MPSSLSLRLKAKGLPPPKEGKAFTFQRILNLEEEGIICEWGIRGHSVAKWGKKAGNGCSRVLIGLQNLGRNSFYISSSLR